MHTEKTQIPPKYTPDWLDKMDGRTTVAKIVRDRLDSLHNDLGGIDGLSYQKKSLCKRAVWLEAVIESQELALAKGEDVDQGKMTQATNSLIGLFRVLGMERQARQVDDLNTFLQRRKND
jgi:hypothetical protein